MEIAAAEKADLEEILSLQKLAYLSEAEIYNDYNIQPLVQTFDEIKSEFDTHMFLKATHEGRIIGSVRALDAYGVCTIYKLMVHPNFQNKGIGKSLIKKIEEAFYDCKRFELFTGQKSSRNIQMYQKLGYKRFKTVRLNDEIEMVYLCKEM